MTRNLLSPTVILDETPAAVRRSGRWLGLLWFTSLPLHFSQAYFFREVFRLGEAAREYGDYLSGLALASFAALVPAVWGRAVFVRACLLGLQSGVPPGREALRVPGPVLATALYTTLLVEILFYATVWTYVAIPFIALLGALATATAHRAERPGLFRPLREIGSELGDLGPMISLLFVYLVAFAVALVNVYVLFLLGLWAAGGVAGDLARWEHLLRPWPFFSLLPAEGLTRWIVLTGAVTFVEPFWLASFAVLVHRSRLRETGEDLRAWFRRLTQAS
jgi:hypothetical protein